jgi:ferric-dicitrate binding protein FerR (iron transport regulator)
VLSAMLLITTGMAKSQVSGPELAGAAKLLSFTGQISVMRDSAAWALNVGDLVQPEQVVVTGADGYGMFQVADGSKFEVFPNSHVVFRANRGDWKDLLEVWLGKVRVQIEHLGGLPNHNKVRTPTAVISVRGTIFDVEVEDADATTLVLDEEGQVEVRHLLKPGDAKMLGPGEWVRIFRNEPLARKMIDKGGVLRGALRAASDAFYQAAINGAHNGPSIRGTPTGPPADQKNGNPPPPPPPPPH